MTKASFLSLLSLVAVIFSANLSAQDIKNGEKLYKKCAACHGPAGLGNKGQGAPKIAGQYDWYIISSIEAFLSGKRANPKMLPFIKGLSKSEIADVALFVSKMP